MLFDAPHPIAHGVGMHVQPLRRRGHVAEAVQIGAQRLGQHGIPIAQFSHSRIDQSLIGADHRDDLVEKHGGARLFQ